MMIKRYKQLCSKIFFGAAILLSMGNLFAGDGQKIGDIHASASGNAKVIGHASYVKTDNLMQNQGGQAAVHLNLGQAPLEREWRPDQYFAQGEALINKNPPKWEEALQVFLYAANAEPPLVLACIRCAEFYQKLEPPQVTDALHYYNRALSTPVKPEAAYRGLMKLHHQVGSKLHREAKIKENFNKAKEYGEQITIPTEDDENILDDIDSRLSKLTTREESPMPSPKALVAEAILVSVASEVDSNANVFAKAMVQAQEEQKLREEQLQKQLLEAEKKAAETEKNRQRELEAERQKRLAAEEESKKAKREVERLEEQRQKELRDSEARESAVAVARPLKSGPAIPDIARGYEEIYLRFLNGKLIYNPTKGSDAGKIELLIRDIMNPNTLEGVFDLSRCGDAGKYLSINTGYRKEKKAANKDKVEIWFAPRFLIEKELGATAGHFREIMTDAKWPKTAGIGLFYTWGSWDNLGWYDYLTTNNPDQLGDNNLYEKWTVTVAAARSAIATLRCLGAHHSSRTPRQQISCYF